jgi:hypothetical protein
MNKPIVRFDPYSPLRRKFLSIKAKSSRGRALKNVLTAKKGLFWGDLAEKQGAAQGKEHFFLCFSCLLGFLAPQAVDGQKLAWTGPLQEKSCLKTYGRFLGFCGLW